MVFKVKVAEGERVVEIMVEIKKRTAKNALYSRATNVSVSLKYTCRTTCVYIWALNNAFGVQSMRVECARTSESVLLRVQ